MHMLKVGGDGSFWIRLFFEPDQLGMVPIALCAALQHRLGEQPFPPERDEADRIKVFGV